MPDFFGPGSDGAVTTRPSLTPQTPRTGTPTWFAPCSSETSDDGTQFSAEWGNVVSANLAEVCTRAGIDPVTVVPGSDDTLVEAILALISDALPSLDGYVTDGELATAIAGFITAGTLVGVQTFTASGTYTRSAGVTAAVAYVVPGGGAGGGCPAGSNNIAGGGGGGGEVRLVKFAPSATHAIAVGAGGTGVAGSTGNAGGDTSISGVCTAKGGLGGLPNGGLGGAAGTGGSGGTSLGAGPGGHGTAGFVAYGGGNFFGPGGGLSFTSPSKGLPGPTPGAGGGGANGNNNTGGAVEGGDGHGGIVIIWEYK